jgi:NAD+ synthase
MSRREEIRKQLELNAVLASQALSNFISDAVETSSTTGVVIGLSGGVDSALATALAFAGLGSDRVHAFMLPYRTSNPDSLEDAEAVASAFDLEVSTIDITPMVDIYFQGLDSEADRIRIGNKMARERMSILFDQAKRLGCLVLGTSNKTEILLGYSTLFGDNASSINPLGDLYKQQVWQLARHLEIPARIVDKAPSADLWPDQTDEGELGFDYPTADEVLYLIFDRGWTQEEVVEAGYPIETVQKITRLEERNRYKRRLMLIARLSSSAINLDREIPRD